MAQPPCPCSFGKICISVPEGREGAGLSLGKGKQEQEQLWGLGGYGGTNLGAWGYKPGVSVGTNLEGL